LTENTDKKRYSSTVTDKKRYSSTVTDKKVIKKLKRFYIYKQTKNKMITNFTTDELIAELKKRGCVIQVIKPKTYELQDDCWSIVKEYAGIYNWTTQWFKMDKIGIDRLHTYYRTSFHRRFTNIHCNIPKSRQRILKNIVQRFKTKEVMQDLRDMVEPKKIEPKKKDMSWLREVKVGDEVYAKVSRMEGELLGVITKINKSSASFRWYPTRRHEVVDGIRRHYYTKEYITKSELIYKCRKPTNEPLDYC